MTVTAEASVPVLVVGAGPTGITVATLLAQYGIRCLVLDRYASTYPQPRAVHLDDEVHRIIARLGVGAEFAAISRPAMGLRLLDHDFRLLAEFRRDADDSRPRLPPGQHVRPARTGGAVASQPQEVSRSRTARRRRRHQHQSARSEPRPRHVHRPVDRRTASGRSRLRLGLRWRQQHYAYLDRRRDGRPRFRAALVGRRRRDRGRVGPVGRRAPGLRSRCAPQPT